MAPGAIQGRILQVDNQQGVIRAEQLGDIPFNNENDSLMTPNLRHRYQQGQRVVFVRQQGKDGWTAHSVCPLNELIDQVGTLIDVHPGGGKIETQIGGNKHIIAFTGSAAARTKADKGRLHIILNLNQPIQFCAVPLVDDKFKAVSVSQDAEDIKDCLNSMKQRAAHDESSSDEDDGFDNPYSRSKHQAYINSLMKETNGLGLGPSSSSARGSATPAAVASDAAKASSSKQRKWLAHNVPLKGVKFSKDRGAREGVVFEVAKDHCLIDSGTDEYDIVHAPRPISIPHCEDLRTLYQVNDGVFFVLTSEHNSQYKWAANLMCPQSYILHDQGTVQSVSPSAAMLKSDHYGIVRLPAVRVCRTWNRSSAQLTDILNIGDRIYFRGVLDKLKGNQFKVLNAHNLTADETDDGRSRSEDDDIDQLKHRCEVQSKLLSRIMEHPELKRKVQDNYPRECQAYMALDRKAPS